MNSQSLGDAGKVRGLWLAINMMNENDMILTMIWFWWRNDFDNDMIFTIATWLCIDIALKADIEFLKATLPKPGLRIKTISFKGIEMKAYYIIMDMSTKPVLRYMTISYPTLWQVKIVKLEEAEFSETSGFWIFYDKW